MSRRLASSGTVARALSLWERDSTTSVGGMRSSSAMVTKALLGVPTVLALSP